MRKIVFDIETTNATGRVDPETMDIALVAIHDSETDRYQSFLVEELGQLWPIIERADVLIGFNSDHFDIPLLNRYYSGDLFRLKSVDLLKEIKIAIGRRIKLDVVAEATLGEKKSGHGLEAVQWWQDGDVEKVRQYCIDDVRITKALYDHAKKHSKLAYYDFGKKRDIPLDTSAWEQAEQSGMTHTMPF